jgi:hypothetical protein
MRSNAHDPRTIAGIRTILASLMKEIDASLRPVHPARTICELASAADFMLEVVQY